MGTVPHLVQEAASILQHDDAHEVQCAVWLTGEGRCFVWNEDTVSELDLWSELGSFRMRGFMSWEHGGVVWWQESNVPVVSVREDRTALDLAFDAVWWSGVLGSMGPGLLLVPDTYPELDAQHRAMTIIESKLLAEARNSGDVMKLARQTALIRRERRGRLRGADVAWEQEQEQAGTGGWAAVKRWQSGMGSQGQAAVEEIIDCHWRRLREQGSKGEGMNGRRLLLSALAMGVLVERLGGDPGGNVDAALEQFVEFDGGAGDDRLIDQVRMNCGYDGTVQAESEFVLMDEDRRRRDLVHTLSGPGVPFTVCAGGNRLSGCVWSEAGDRRLGKSRLFSPPCAFQFGSVYVAAGVPVVVDFGRGLINASVVGSRVRFVAGEQDVDAETVDFDSIDLATGQLTVVGGRGKAVTNEQSVTISFERDRRAIMEA